MTASTPIPRPFALAIGAGWSRAAAEDLLASLLGRSDGPVDPCEDDGYGHRGIRCGWTALSITRGVHEAEKDDFDPDHTLAFAIAVLRAMLDRSEDEAMERLTIADAPLATAGLLWAADGQPRREHEVNASARTLRQPPRLGFVERSQNGWSASMQRQPRLAHLPFCLKVDLVRTRLHIYDRDFMIRDVGTLDPVQRLRLEARLVAELDAVSHLRSES